MSAPKVTIVTAAGERHVPRSSKREVARRVLDTVVELRAGTVAGRVA